MNAFQCAVRALPAEEVIGMACLISRTPPEMVHPRRSGIVYGVSMVLGGFGEGFVENGGDLVARLLN